MIATKKKKTLSDKILKFIEEDLEDKDDSSEDEAKIAEFDEQELSASKKFTLSDIRKKNVKHLSDLDKKYCTKISSRKSMQEDDIGDEKVSSDSDGDSIDAEETEDEGENSVASDDQNGDTEESVDDEDQNENDATDNSEENGSLDEEYDGSDDSDDESLDNEDYLGTKDSGPIDRTKLLDDASSQITTSLKGNCIRNQLKLWENLLESRIKLQPLIITSNSLPFPDKFDELKTRDSKFGEAVENSVNQISSLLDSLLELQSNLASSFPESKDINFRKRKLNEKKKSSKKCKLDEFSEVIESNYNNYKNYRNNIIKKWDDRTRAVTNIKNGNNLNIVSKIDNALLNKDEFVKKSQIYNGDYRICGEEEKDKTNNEEIHFPEIHDDSSFYHNLLRELIDYKTNTSDSQADMTKKFIQLQKIRSTMKKKVDTRASKGRRIRFVESKCSKVLQFENINLSFVLGMMFTKN